MVHHRHQTSRRWRRNGHRRSPARALLWNGTAASVVDLQPTNASLNYFTGGTAAYGTDGTHQAGEGYLGNGDIHAMSWGGTAASAADLNPSNLGYSQSSAESVSGSQQAGLGVGNASGFNEHAMIWSGTAASAIDINPTNLPGISTSFLKSTNGARQAGTGSGSGTGGNDHALLRSGTANSAVDLHLLLPAGFTVSNADSIDAQNNIFGEAIDSTGALHAIEWSPLLLGDLNLDGQLSSTDISSLLHALTDESNFRISHNLSVAQMNALGDFNHDGAVTNKDIQPLLDAVGAAQVLRRLSLNLRVFGCWGSVD